MADKTDLRVARTRTAIKEAFEALVLENSLDRITVKALTEHAGINRKTFYLHYETIESLYDEILTEIMDDDLYEVFYELTSGMRTDTDPLAFLFLAIIIVVSVLPVVFMRFRLNVVSFDDSDMRVMGVRPELLRVFVLIMGTLMILAAQIHVGVISMVALVVPFLTRYVVGSEFGKQLIGNMILGPALLLLCRIICGLIPFVNGGLSLEMVVGFVALPVYIWMMALGKRGWE